MEILVNLIHPYVFKIQEDSLIIGPIKEFKNRDKKVVNFLNKSLDYNATILHHRNLPVNNIHGALLDVSFRTDPIWEQVYQDSRIKTIVTTDFGIPINDVKPKHISEEDWETLTQNYTKDSDYEKIICKPEITFFLGGTLEACLSNAVSYYNLYYRKTNEKVFYVPELCVCLKPNRKDIEKELEKKDIQAISYEEANYILKN